MPFTKHRVVSVQSHVVQGDVGNKGAVLPLQLLGHRVDAVHTVQFTSATVHRGYRVSEQNLRDIMEELPKGWESTETPYLLSGYVDGVASLKQLNAFYQTSIKGRDQTTVNSPYRWICDPVLGDNGKLYVNPAMIDGYRTFVLPYADIVTPNKYELQWLTSKHVNNLDDAKECCKILHKEGTSVVIVTSLDFETTADHNMLYLLGSMALDEHHIETFTLEFPRINVYLSGTGDIFTALFLHGLDRFHQNIKQASQFALKVTQIVIKDTLTSNKKPLTIDVMSSLYTFLQLRCPTLSPKNKFD